MFILCKGEQAKEPYTIPVTGVRVYSLEELCYYLYNNIYRVTEEFFEESLAVWLKNEVKEKALAEKMRVLIRRRNNLKDLVVTLLCSCDYYKEEEVRGLVAVLEKIENLPQHQKDRIKADNYLSAGKYGRSLQEYRKLLSGEEAEQFSPEEYGDILHNQAIAQLFTASFKEAVNGFKEAYARNQNQDTLTQYLYALLMEGQEEMFLKEGVSYGKTTEELTKLRERYQGESEKCRGVKRDFDFIGQCKDELRDFLESV